MPVKRSRTSSAWGRSPAEGNVAVTVGQADVGWRRSAPPPRGRDCVAPSPRAGSLTNRVLEPSVRVGDDQADVAQVVGHWVGADLEPRRPYRTGGHPQPEDSAVPFAADPRGRSPEPLTCSRSSAAVLGHRARGEDMDPPGRDQLVHRSAAHSLSMGLPHTACPSVCRTQRRVPAGASGGVSSSSPAGSTMWGTRSWRTTAPSGVCDG